MTVYFKPYLCTATDSDKNETHFPNKLKNDSVFVSRGIVIRTKILALHIP